MKILMISNHLGVQSGVQRYVQNLLLHLDTAKYRVTLFVGQCPPDQASTAPALEAHGVEILAVPDNKKDRIRALAAHPRVRAIGEIGLDYYWVKTPEARAFSRDFFDAQLSLAEELDLPAIVHDRDAHKDCLDIVRSHPNARGVFHCCALSLEDAKVAVDRGWMLSFTGNITFSNARRAPEVVRWVPLDRLMLETDAPYMAPEPHRGERCDSSFLPLTAARVAQLKGLETGEVLRATLENGKRFFNIL